MKKHNYTLIFGACLTALMAALIIIGFLWTPYNPREMDAALKLTPPSTAHILGTDNFGRDIFSRLLEGVGATAAIAAATVFIGATAGILIGGLTGYFGGWPDEILMRLSDTVTSFPSILLALVFISLTGPGKYNVILVLGILFVPSFARIVRAEFYQIRSLDYVVNARLMGVGHFRVMFVHILPNAMPVIASSAAIGFNNAALAEASMSFLGVGAQPTDASIGRMLFEAQTYFRSAPWYALSAGFALVLLILGLSLLSEGISGN